MVGLRIQHLWVWRPMPTDFVLVFFCMVGSIVWRELAVVCFAALTSSMCWFGSMSFKRCLFATVLSLGFKMLMVDLGVLSCFCPFWKHFWLQWLVMWLQQWILPIPLGWKSRVEISKQERDSGVGCVQRTGRVADKDLGRISRRPAGRFNVIHCSPVPPAEDDESRGSAGSKHSTNSNKEEVVMQYAVSSNPDVVLTLR